MVLTTRTRFIVTISQVVAVLGASYTDMNGFKKRTPRPFVCNALRALDSSTIVDTVGPITSDQSISSVTNHDNPVSVSTGVKEKDKISTTFITSGRSNRQTTNNVSTLLSGFSEIASTTPPTIKETSDPTTVLTTSAFITTRGVTSSNATIISKAGTTTNEITGMVSSDPSTVGFTTIETTVMSSTEERTQGTTNTSVTVVTSVPVTTTAIAQTTKATCPVGYSAVFNNSCYKISNDSDPTLSRSDARKLCESESAHLVFIESKEEDDFLINITSPDKQYWIGANGLPDDFYWDDGSNIEFKSIAEQNIAFDDLRGCYRMKIAGNESSWPDAPCFRRYNYICEYDLERRTKQCPDDISICSQIEWIALDWNWEHTAPELKNSVPAYMDGAVFVDSMRNYASRGIHHLVYRSNDSSNNWCSFRLVTDCMTWDEVSILNASYTLVSNWLRWYEAAEACIFYDSNLVTVENEDENSWLQSFISSKGNDVWIGLSTEDETDGWKWQNRNSTNQFFNWGGFQPSTWYSCTVLDAVSAKWKTKSCDSSTPFLCERRL